MESTSLKGAVWLLGPVASATSCVITADALHNLCLPVTSTSGRDIIVGSSSGS